MAAIYTKLCISSFTLEFLWRSNFVTGVQVKDIWISIAGIQIDLKKEEVSSEGELGPSIDVIRMFLCSVCDRFTFYFVHILNWAQYIRFSNIDSF